MPGYQLRYPGTFFFVSLYGPVDLAGLRAGDVITMVDAATVMSSNDLTSTLGGKSYKAGDTATVAYVRDGQIYTLASYSAAPLRSLWKLSSSSSSLKLRRTGSSKAERICTIVYFFVQHTRLKQKIE